VPVKQISSVEVGFDREFIEKWLDRQKYVWYSIILLLAVTLAGLLGRGPLGKRTVSAGEGQLSATYEPVAHYRMPAAIELHLPERVLQEDHVYIALEGAVTKKAAFQQIIPQPVSVAPLPDGIVADIPLTATSSEGRVMIFQQPSAVGFQISKITLDSGSSWN
jgi:hypothetical protein